MVFVIRFSSSPDVADDPQTSEDLQGLQASEDPRASEDIEHGSYHSILKLSKFDNISCIILSEEKSIRSPLFLKSIKKLLELKVDIAFLADCAYSGIAPRYLYNSEELKIVRATTCCCMGGIYLGKDYAQCLSTLDNNDQMLVRIMNDVESGSISAVRCYPQILSCSLDIPHTPHKANVDLIGRYPKYPYTGYIILLFFIFCILLIIVVIVAIVRRKPKIE